MTRADDEQFAELARRFAARRLNGPSAQLRERILAAVDTELSRKRPDADWAGGIGFLTSLAASVLIGLTFSIFASSQAPTAASRRVSRATIAWRADELRKLSPLLSADDATRLAILDEAGSNLLCLPQPKGSSASAGGDSRPSGAE